ncbi:MAG: 5'/3'-nucleotidase SurE [Prevotellaceae bacterium]|jgi:5'-nucleotidase|nr:5'/3'-nucleotidase SurE [Prevotellaceae bacterium]
MSKPLILVTNDDGVDARGLAALIEMVKPYGLLVVVAPERSQSGMSHALTFAQPLRLRRVSKTEDISIYACSGTPVDCVKLAMGHAVSDTPTLLVSGVNHGSNSSVSVLYSGTLGAAAEGSLYEIPSIGFSLLNTSRNADFSASIHYGRKIIEKVLEDSFHPRTYLNINIPKLSIEEIKGIKLCRQTDGTYREEYEKRVDPHGGEYYWLTGTYINNEPDATDTDEYFLEQGYVTVVPVHPDMTAYEELNRMKKTWGSL